MFVMPAFYREMNCVFYTKEEPIKVLPSQVMISRLTTYPLSVPAH